MRLSAKERVRLKGTFGDWAVVTGATSGIGMELATQLADAGFNLVINARGAEALRSQEKMLSEKYSVRVVAVEADLSTADGIDKLIRASQPLSVGLLINNAGYGTSGLFTESDLKQETDMLKVNCEAVLSLTHHFATKFKQQHRGGIVFLSSVVAFQGVPYAANYAATKAFIQSFAEALAIELKPFGVSVLAASPGPVESNFGKRANMRMGKGMSPSEIGAPILAALGKQSNVIPGVLSKILVYSLRTLPRFAKVRVMQIVMGGFTKHQRESISTFS